METWTWTKAIGLAVCVGLGAACSGPVAPGPVGTSAPPAASPPPAPVERVSLLIVGTVVDETGAPIARASIVARYPDGAYSSGQTDTRGEFRVSHVLPVSATLDGRITLRASRNGYTASEVNVPAATVSQQAVRIEIASRHTRLTVGETVVTSLGADDPPCYVGEPYEDPYSRHCRWFRFDSPPGHQTEITLTWTDESPLIFWIDDAGMFRGAVRSSTTNTAALTIPPDRQVWVTVGLEGADRIGDVALPFTLTASAR